MTFRESMLHYEMGLQYELGQQSVDAEATMLRFVLDNQGPVLNTWFILMMVNLLAILLFIH